METKSVFLSKEIWLVIFGILNYALNRFNLPSFEPTAEFYSALLVILGFIRVYWTKAGVHLFKKKV